MKRPFRKNFDFDLHMGPWLRSSCPSGSAGCGGCCDCASDEGGDGGACELGGVSGGGACDEDCCVWAGVMELLASAVDSRAMMEAGGYTGEELKRMICLNDMVGLRVDNGAVWDIDELSE